MSINPPSDLLLDVARAADPTVSAAAAERLAKIGGQGSVVDTGFSEVLDGVQMPSANPADVSDFAADSRVAMRPSTPVDPKQKAYQGLEAMLLQNLVETMLPDDSQLFGEGSAGVVWRSMLAQELGTDIAKKVDLGIEPRFLRSANTAHRSKPADGDVSHLGNVADVRHVSSKPV